MREVCGALEHGPGHRGRQTLAGAKGLGQHGQELGGYLSGRLVGVPGAEEHIGIMYVAQKHHIYHTEITFPQPH